jgi:hypothetical protein
MLNAVMLSVVAPYKMPADAKGWRVPIEKSETYQITMFCRTVL